jgi:RNA polymerase sigma factor (TIGR02999 family)
MSDVTRLLDAIRLGDRQASDRLLPLVYEELRRLARAQMVQERPDHTLQSTALVHEAYLRLIGDGFVSLECRGHFFAAAAEAMRRILIEHARSKNAHKRGGGQKRVDLDGDVPAITSPADEFVDLLALDEALAKLAAEAPQKAQLVKLRYFAGLSLEESAKAMNISLATVKRYWAYARAWLFKELSEEA